VHPADKRYVPTEPATGGLADALALRCSPERSGEPHARTKDEGPHAALRAANVYKCCDYADVVVSTPSRCAARRSVSVKPHARTKDEGPHAALRAVNVYKSGDYADVVVSTPSRCAARRSVSVKPHVRTKTGGPHSALRIIDVYISGSCAGLIQFGLRKHRHFL